MGSIKFIKERKKRGRKPKKINASLDEKLQKVQWGEYRIGELFEVSTSKGYDAGKMNFVSKSRNRFEFIGRTKDNYGVQGFVEKLNTSPNNAETISVSQVGAVHAQIRKNKWYSSQNIFVLNPIYKELINLLVATAIDKILVNYGGYSSYPTLQTLKEHVIQLPTKNGEIDFEFMESFVAELNAQRVAELNAYLTITGLKDYELTEEEKNLLENIDNIEYKELKIIDVFQVKNAGNILAREVELNSGDTPYLCASAENNSISSYINYNRILKDEGNCIFIGGKTFVVSYQEKDFYSNDSHNLALYLLDNEQRVKDIQLFLSSCVKKSLGHKYSWGDSISNKKIQKDLILVPMKDGKIDYDIMKKIHRIIEKIVIKDVVLWADKKIEATKQVADIG